MTKTLKQEAEEWVSSRFDYRDYQGQLTLDDAEESYQAGYRAAQPKWLSPKDHPPADGTWAVIHMRDGSKSQGTTAIDFAKNGDWEDWMYEVTFYLPLPKLPKEEE